MPLALVHCAFAPLLQALQRPARCRGAPVQKIRLHGPGPDPCKGAGVVFYGSDQGSKLSPLKVSAGVSR